jgi:hypothetical protein
VVVGGPGIGWNSGPDMSTFGIGFGSNQSAALA